MILITLYNLMNLRRGEADLDNEDLETASLPALGIKGLDCLRSLSPSPSLSLSPSLFLSLSPSFFLSLSLFLSPSLS